MPHRRITDEEIRQKLQETFSSVATDKDGLITPEDLKAACEMVGFKFKPNTSDFQELTAACDPEGNGMINFDAFATAMVKTHKYKIVMRMRYAFSELDTDGSGFITKDNLKELVAAQGCEELSDEDADKMIATCDHSGDGKVSFAEFDEKALNYIEEKLKEKA